MSFNYRLARFGFFAFPALSKEQGAHPTANFGLLDQIAALQWVKRGKGARVPVMVGATNMDIGFMQAKSMDELFAQFGDKPSVSDAREREASSH